jgi:hypothetical protein
MTAPIIEEDTRRHIVRRRVITAVIALAAIGLLVLAATRTRRGDPEPVLDGLGIVEQFSPANGDDVLSQHPVSIDLTIDWQGVITRIGETAIPEHELIQRTELAQVIYEPGPGKTLERLPAGPMCATAEVWRVDRGRQAGVRPVTWCFTVT